MNPEPGTKVSLHVPLTLLALAAALFLGAQISAMNRSAQTMSWQRGNLDKQADELGKAKAQLDELIKQRDESVTQAAQVQEQFTVFLREVIELAKTDEDSRKVVEKWQIKVQDAPTSAPERSEAPKK